MSTYLIIIKTMTKNIAFIGLGVMGSAMASNIVRGGYDVLGWNRSSDRVLVKLASENGVKIFSTMAETVQNADYIFTCVSDVKDVESVIFAQNAIAANAPKNALIVDFSTIGTKAAIDIGNKLKQRNLRFMDAPVSGGDIGAQKGTLTMMIGGEKADFEECLPILETMGKKIVLCGNVGSGQAVKLCNQILCALNMIGICEAIKLTEQLNIDPNLMIDICNSGAAGSWALSNLAPKITNADYNPGFMIKHILKDLRLVQESAGDQDLPGVLLADQLFKIVQELGGEEQGTQAMIRAYENSLKPHIMDS